MSVQLHTRNFKSTDLNKQYCCPYRPHSFLGEADEIHTNNCIISMNVYMYVCMCEREF